MKKVNHEFNEWYEKMINKVERYGWNKIINNNGLTKYKEIDIKLLRVDYRYQRNVINQRTVDKITRNFDWDKFNALVVADRSDGFYYIIDGGHRFKAAKRRQDIKKLPCIVKNVSSLKQEADIFLALNLGRVTVHAIDKYKAKLTSGILHIIEIEKLLTKFNLNLKYHSRHIRDITCIDFIEKLYIKNSLLLEQALELSLEIADPASVQKLLLAAVFELLSKNIPLRNEVQKIIIAGGQTTLISESRKLQILTNSKNAISVVPVALLNIINKNKRKKYTI